jgi:energy-coupling factor transporter ATP-binding protein EcfA2
MQPKESKLKMADSKFISGINHDTWDFSQLIIRSRFAEALNEGITRYPIFRDLRFAARTDLVELFDRIALSPGWRTQRLSTRNMLLDADNFFVSAGGNRTGDYSSCYFGIWANSPDTAEEVKKAILEHVKETRIEEPMFSIDWHFLTSKRDLESAEIEELADDVLYDEAYPALKAGVADFIQRYIQAGETVLVLQGPPGTGKTRLIRAILGAISRRKNGKAHALYTADMKALENDEIFVKFITGWDDVFVVEDADHLLKPRADGNENLHRFLSIADGVVRAQGRKIIFSTNLPNVGDLDDALIRPGRCFARLQSRELDQEETGRLLARLCAGSDPEKSLVEKILSEKTKTKHSLAEIYKAIGEAKLQMEPA